MDKYQKELTDITTKIEEEQRQRQDLQVELMLRQREIEALREMMHIQNGPYDIDSHNYVAPGEPQ